MESLFLLIPIALVFCAIAIKLLLWAIDTGQYDDLDKESWRILNDDEPTSRPTGPPLADDALHGAAGGPDSERPTPTQGAGSEKSRAKGAK
jgi:cbb3-type cytochrome oxidase maturation protein